MKKYPTIAMIMLSVMFSLSAPAARAQSELGEESEPKECSPEYLQQAIRAEAEAPLFTPAEPTSGSAGGASTDSPSTGTPHAHHRNANS